MEPVEIVDDQGLMLGLMTDAYILRHCSERRHGHFVQLAWMPPVDFSGIPDRAMPVESMVAGQVVVFRWHEVPMVPSRHRRHERASRWYLVPLNPIPEEAWGQMGLVDLRAAFGRPVPLQAPRRGKTIAQEKQVTVVPGEVVGWRCWAFADNECRVLASTSVGTRWLPGLPMQGNPLDSGEGVHAWKTREQALAYGHGSLHAYGEVELWGVVMEHEQGYRAQFGAIRSLELPADVSKWARDYYMRRTMPIIELLRRDYGVGAPL